jgi:mono/diheme cytochrome c family protein
MAEENEEYGSMKLLLGLTSIVLAFSTPSFGQDSKVNGQELFERWCSHCHGEGEAASIFLEKKYQGSVPAVIEQRNDLTRELVAFRIRTQIPGMPAFRPTELSDEDVALISDYLAGDDNK